jgi:hypothetical protein
MEESRVRGCPPAHGVAGNVDSAAFGAREQQRRAALAAGAVNRSHARNNRPIICLNI